MILKPVNIPGNMRVYSGRRRYVGQAPSGMVDDRIIEQANNALKGKPKGKSRPEKSVSTFTEIPANEKTTEEKSGKK